MTLVWAGRRDDPTPWLFRDAEGKGWWVDPKTMKVNGQYVAEVGGRLVQVVVP